MRDMTKVIFFADTYALIELAIGSQAYKQYLNALLVTTQYNLAELYYHFLRTYGVEAADSYYERYAPSAILVSDTSIREGMKLKLASKKEKLSYADCIGYALAQELGIKFLTGDQKFEDKDNVEFVK